MPPTLRLRALLQATALVGQGLSEERLAAVLARCAAEALAADFSAIYLLPTQPRSGGRSPAWRLAGHWGGDLEALTALPSAFGQGGGVLTPLFEHTREIHQADMLDGAAAAAAVRRPLPGRAIIGVPIRRRDQRSIGVVLVGALRPGAFESKGATDDNALSALDVVRSLAQLAGVGVDNARLARAQRHERRLTAESAVTLDTVLGSVGNGVCVVELDGTVRVANQTLRNLFGLPANAVGTAQEALFAAALVKPRAADAFQQRLEALIADPTQADQSEWELATDPPRIVQRHSTPMRSEVGEVVGHVEVYTDVTESRRLYTLLLHSEKLRAIGEMASGVAHDFNNLLASIVGQTELLHTDDLPPPTRRSIVAIRQAALDGARMVRNLLGLARPRIETPSTPADLNEAVQQAVEMARPRWASAALHGQGAIEVQLSLAEAAALARVALDPAELREVLLNLLFNAAEAMPGGGVVHISTRAGAKPDTAELEVRDTGQGMTESVRARVFEPFFSTKGPKGSGLGLAVAYSMLSRRGATIEVASSLGRGTTFTLVLPHVPMGAVGPDHPASGAHQNAHVAQQSARGAVAAARLQGARILVADDEPGLVAIVRQLLERCGAVVATANGGKAAVEALRVPNVVFDVVVTDLDMPGVDGWAVASAVKAHSPQTKVVMLTGWAGELALEDFRSRGVDVLLPKPCGRAELESAIGNLLSPRPAAGLDVLLVDDEPRFARALEGLLRLQGHQVAVVASADGARAAIAGHTFDVVLTDYSLGAVTGAQLAEELADQATTAYVILVTGYATEIDDLSLMSRGVHAVLPKPCRGDDLRQVLARVRTK